MTTHPVLRLENVTKRYGRGPDEVLAVADVTIELTPGELVLVMGPSGSGKTTLMQLSGGLLRPNSGAVWLDGVNVAGLTEKQLPSLRLAKIGFVFQAFELLSNLTAVENVRLVMEVAGWSRRRADARARELLSELGLAGRMDALPATLSGGEKQRVAVARALSNDPPLLLADEPTGNLDSRTGSTVMAQLSAAVRQRGKSVLCVTHDHRVRDVADRVLWIEDGAVWDREPPGEGRT